MDHDLLEPLLAHENSIMNTVQAAKLLRVSPKTLAYWRVTGDGPVFLHLGARTVRYRSEDLLAYIAERRMVNTSGLNSEQDPKHRWR